MSEQSPFRRPMMAQFGGKEFVDLVRHADALARPGEPERPTDLVNNGPPVLQQVVVSDKTAG